jgi:hypothetical protein
MRDVVGASGNEVVEADDGVVVAEKPVTEV